MEAYSEQVWTIELYFFEGFRKNLRIDESPGYRRQRIPGLK